MAEARWIDRAVGAVAVLFGLGAFAVVRTGLVAARGRDYVLYDETTPLPRALAIVVLLAGVVLVSDRTDGAAARACALVGAAWLGAWGLYASVHHHSFFGPLASPRGPVRQVALVMAFTGLVLAAVLVARLVVHREYRHLDVPHPASALAAVVVVAWVAALALQGIGRFGQRGESLSLALLYAAPFMALAAVGSSYRALRLSLAGLGLLVPLSAIVVLADPDRWQHSTRADDQVLQALALLGVASLIRLLVDELRPVPPRPTAEAAPEAEIVA